MKDNNDPHEIKKIHVLIISDRLLERAKALSEYLGCTESIDVVGIAESKNQALNIAREHSFDYLIIAGYLKAECTYDVIAELQKQQQKKFLPVQWAILDSLIISACLRYKIPLKFERTLPLKDFVSFLHTHKNDPIPCYFEDAQEIKPVSNQNVSDKLILRKFLELYSG